ncbi:MAG TPA: glycoside-pentoside-hexuronide (GPH):cation symporter [Intrasporangium sp.]|jgi:glucuronide carrier protein|uniref:glycoside-pentoside-hexuronide (GPH):cation symporter n=1 Tax=Intrasporangium sp. TaxID=1925024 RepID=UPI002F945AEE
MSSAGASQDETVTTTVKTVETEAVPDHLRPVQYLGYASGDVANNLTFTLVSMFLLVYYTDVVGIAAGAAGTILFVARVWGAFTDVFAGRMVDKTTTRWGRFRPYFLFGAVPLMLLAAATFSVPGGLGRSATLVYAYVSYMLFYLAYSLVNIPYGSLASAMTQLPDERAKLSSSRMIGAATAIVALNFAVAPQISRSTDLQRSLTITTLIVAVIGIALYLFLFAASREAVVRDEAPVSLRQSVAAIAHNKALLLLCLSALLSLTGMFVLQTLQVYYARDVLGNVDYTIILAILTTGALFVVSPLIPRIVAAFGKKPAYITGGVLTAIGGLGVALVPPSLLWLAMVCFAVYGIGISAVQAVMFALQADTVEFGEWTSGVRTEGSNYAALSFTRKVGQGIGGALAGWGIGVGGYVAGSTTQTPGALDAIRHLTGLGPAVFVGLGAAVMLAYPLTEERFRTIVVDLATRRAERQGRLTD